MEEIVARGENMYNSKILVGNWNEKRFDIYNRPEGTQLPSEFDHYFHTTYKASYSHRQAPVLKQPGLLLTGTIRGAHPGHQPVLDSPATKAEYNSWLTTTRAAYGKSPALEKPQLAAKEDNRKVTFSDESNK